jgi:hypothetical protein
MKTVYDDEYDRAPGRLLWRRSVGMVVMVTGVTSDGLRGDSNLLAAP